MTEKDAYKQLENECPTGYRINELIPFCYPVRRIKIDVLANKQPDGSLVKVYNVMIRAIQMGFDTQEKLFDFLGLSKDDEFMFRELFALREKRYINLVSEKWFVTSEGEQFLQNEKILRIEEKEEFEFLLDGISGEVIFLKKEKEDTIRDIPDKEKYLPQKLTFPIKSPELLEGKYPQLAKLFKQTHPGETLINYDSAGIKRDYREWCKYWLIEYISDRKGSRESDSRESRLEVRSFDSLKREKPLTKQFNAEYQHYIYELTSSERTEVEEMPEIVEEASQKSQIPPADVENLGIWKTKQQFIDALRQVKEKILIESPWIKQATQEYIPLFEDLLKKRKQLIILYGISEKDEHNIQTLKQLEELQKKYNKTFILIHLPTHIKKNVSKLTGTHRKLLIKDNEYYISGSYNFLSFGKHEQDKVANEESLLIRRGVQEKWDQVIKEYMILLSNETNI
ncbi:phospholipase D-like domain-containing protein [Breznakiellaceae bacterium SP9]